MKWINVKDQLPEFNVEVLGYGPFNFSNQGSHYVVIKYVHLCNRPHFMFGPYVFDDLTHWTPLPPKPEIEEEEVLEERVQQVTCRWCSASGDKIEIEVDGEAEADQPTQA